MNVVLDGFIVNNQSKAKTNLESEIVELRESVARLEKQLSVAKEEVETQKKSEGNWRTLAENSLDQIMILDLDYTIQFINYTSYGVKRENILGKSPLHFVPPDQHQVCIDCFKEVIKSGKPGRYETRYVTDEKETHHYDVRVAPITREDGKVTGLIISFNDITNNNRMKDLLESEEKHRNLFETMVQGVVYQAGDGSIISANTAAERILGVTLAQLQGRTSMDPSWKSIREDGSDFPGDQHPSMTALKTGKKVIGVVMGVFNPKKQDNTWMKVNAVPRFHEGEEKPFQVFTTFEDITHSKNLEEQLKKSYNQLIDLKENAETANKLKSQFLANMSHDIRTPLNAV
ncbi:MAG: PAS domain S-box protein, partial [bacterium]|nr:PAS domain S-box protein [bacterium]